MVKPLTKDITYDKVVTYDYIVKCLNDLFHYPIFLMNKSAENRTLFFVLTNTFAFNESKWKHIPRKI